MTSSANASIIPCKAVKSVQFCVFSDEEKKDLSVVKLDKIAGFEAGIHVRGSPYDILTGTITDTEVCGTCKLSQKEDPGHYGHIELHRMVCNPLYISDVVKILNCICFTCASSLVPISYHEGIKRLAKSKRLSKCKEYSKDKKCTVCGRQEKNPTFSIRNDTTIFYKPSKTVKGKKDVPKFLPCEFIKDLFRRLKNDTIILMGFDVRYSRPENLIMGVILVPPPNIRPTVEKSVGKRAEDNLYKLLSEIIKKNEALNKKIKAKNIPLEELTLEYENLAQWVSYLMVSKSNSKKSNATYASGGAPIKSIQEDIKGKGGLIRSNIMGKRVDESGRTVISPDVNFDVDEIGIPLKMAMILTFPEIVNDDNIEKIKGLIRNGAKKYPGAIMLESAKTGRRKMLTGMTDEMKDTVLESLSKGDIVRRHLIDGDVVLFNRQPTLHKYGMMAYTIKVLKNNHTIRLGLATTEAHNADFDGDESNLHVPVHYETVVETRKLMGARNHIISMSKSSVLISLIQDNVLGLYLMSKYGHEKISREVFMILVAASRYYKRHLIPDGKKEFELIECINNVLPETLHIPELNIKHGRFQRIDMSKKISSGSKRLSKGDAVEAYKKSKMLEEKMLTNDVLVQDSTIENLYESTYGDMFGKFKRDDEVKSPYTILTKSKITHLLIKKIFTEYGPNAANDIIVSLQKLTNKFLVLYGFTCSIQDVIIPKDLKAKFRSNIEKSHEAVENLLNDFDTGKIKTPPTTTVYDNYEDRIGEVMAPYKTENAKLMEDHIKGDKTSNFANMIASGSKGKMTNVLHINVEIGEQAIMGKRLPRTYGYRTLPHFTKFEECPRSRGAIPRSFSEGMDAIDFFSQSAAGRAGLMDTSLGVRKTGYIERRLVKFLEDINCTYDNMVRRVGGMALQILWGGTGFNNVYLEDNVLEIKSKTDENLVSEFL